MSEKPPPAPDGQDQLRKNCVEAALVIWAGVLSQAEERERRSSPPTVAYGIVLYVFLACARWLVTAGGWRAGALVEMIKECAPDWESEPDETRQ